MNIGKLKINKSEYRYSTRNIFAVLLAFTFISNCSGLGKRLVLTTASDTQKFSVVRVNVTRQGYNFHRPWQQLTPRTHTAIGVIIEGPQVLVTASHLANHRYIELEKIDSGQKSEAELQVVDYEANLALITAVDEKFLEGMRPLPVAVNSIQGDELEVWQVKPNGNIIPSMGTITAIEPASYYYDNHFLVYRLNGSLQYRFRNFTLPVVNNGKLAGLVMRYDAKRQTIDVLAAPVIEHFLEDTADGTYRGFPITGIRIVSTEDPQLRKYLGLPDSMGGVYVEGVAKDSAAEKAGIRIGDIIYEISGYPIDSHGNFEHPLYGKIALSHLIRCEFHVGEQIEYKVFRSGERLSTEVVPDHKSPEEYLVPPYVVDVPPRYYILGGLVLQELSANYLRVYGKNWRVKAPVHLAYYNSNQHFLENEDREKIVFLSGALPTSYTIGYEKLSNMVITRINDQAVGKLEDVPKALKNPVYGFHKIEFEERPKVIYLDPAEIPEINAQIRKRYHLPALENMN